MYFSICALANDLIKWEMGFNEWAHWPNQKHRIPNAIAEKQIIISLRCLNKQYSVHAIPRMLIETNGHLFTIHDPWYPRSDPWLSHMYTHTHTQQFHSNEMLIIYAIRIHFWLKPYAVHRTLCMQLVEEFRAIESKKERKKEFK